MPSFVGSMDEEDTATLPRFFKLHGNMSQKDRTQVFTKFRETSAGVLMCTDVAARGLDLPRVDWIVQYNAPARAEDYVHRVGRTARIGEAGQAVIFLLPDEAGFVNLLQDSKISLEELALDKVLECVLDVTGERKHQQQQRFGKLTSRVEHAATDLQLQFENALLNEAPLLELGRKAFQSYIRFYSSYPYAVRNVFHYRSLHLGHAAKSMALRETPSQLGVTQTMEGKRVKLGQKMRTVIQQHRRSEPGRVLSEYHSGIDGTDNSTNHIHPRPPRKEKINKVKRPAPIRPKIIIPSTTEKRNKNEIRVPDRPPVERKAADPSRPWKKYMKRKGKTILDKPSEAKKVRAKSKKFKEKQ
jgi:superfamily II DNA/RNA helicase